MALARRAAVILLSLIALASVAAASCTEPDADFDRALAYARNGRHAEARDMLLDCARTYPSQKRYLAELAGLAYLDGDHPAARRYLHRVLDLDPADTYAGEFLGTLYFLDRNLPAALKYWNRAGKPHIASAVLPRNLSFDLLALPPGEQLRLDDLLTVQARLEALRLGPAAVDLSARPDGDYEFRMATPTGGARLAAISGLRGLAYQSITPEWRNIANTGVSWSGLFRWDAQKRRIDNAVTIPLSQNAKWRLDLGADLRRETWNTGTSEDFRLQSTEARAAIGAVESGRFQWSTGLSLSTRSFHNAPTLEDGTALESQTRARVVLYEHPESRFMISTSGAADAGRFFAGGGSAYSRLRADVTTHWQPRSNPRADEFVARFSTGGILGTVPFDRQFILGMERDTDLWLRGHSATRDGKKGSGLIGRNYALLNTTYEFELYRASFVTIAAGPFFDTGRIPGVPWQFDAGAQARLTVLGRVSLLLSWGRDLRAGRNRFYVSNGIPGPPI